MIYCMKLKRKIFSKNILIFLFYIFFAGGVAFAQNSVSYGMLAPESETTINCNNGNWTYDNGDPVIWDGSVSDGGHPYQNLILDTSKASITINLETDLPWIDNLYIFGENECVFNLNGFSISIANLYLGDSCSSATSIDSLINSGVITQNERKGNIKIETGNFNINGVLDTSSPGKHSINLQETTLTVSSGWNTGTKATGAEVPNFTSNKGKIELNEAGLDGEFQTEIIDSVKNVNNNTSVTPPSDPTPTEAIWTGTEDSSWDNPNNWNAGAVLDGSMPIIIDGAATPQPEINSPVSITFTDGNNIAFVNDAKLTIGVSGSLTIDSEKFDFQPDGSKITVNGTLNLTKDSPVEYFTIDSHFDSDSTGKIYCSDNVSHLVVATTFSNLNSIEKDGEDGDITIFQNVKCKSINANSIIIRKDTAPTVEFGSITADSIQNGGDLTVNSELQVSSIINQHKLTIADSVTAIKQLSSISNESELNFNVDAVVEEITNNQNGKITVATGKYLEVKKQFSNTGIFTGSIKFTGDNISENNILGDSNSEYKELLIDTIKSIQFEGDSVIKTLKVENAESVKFFSAVTINKIDDDGFTGNFYFDATKFDQNTGGLSTSEGFKFNTSGVVYIGKDSNSQISFVNAASPVNFTHTAGTTTIVGNVVANEITLAENTIDGTVTGNNITLKSTEISGDSELKINEAATSGKITLNGNITSTGSKTLTLNGNVDAFCSSINLDQGTLKSKGPFTAQNDLLINAICTFGKKVDAKENLTINGASTFNQTVEVENNLTITGDSKFSQNVVVGNIATLQGNVEFLGTFSIIQDTGYLLLNGTGNQDVKLNANDIYKNVIVEKTSGNVEINNVEINNVATIEIENFENSTAGTTTFNAASTISSLKNTSGTIFVKENVSAKNVENEGKITIAEGKIFAISETLKDNNEIGGDGTIKINGTENQNVTLTTKENIGYKNIVVEKASGDVEINNAAIIENFENATAGTTIFNAAATIANYTNTKGISILNGISDITTLKNATENANVKINAATTFDLIENAGLVEINENSTTRSLKNTNKIHIAEGRSLTILETIEDSGEFSGTGALRFTGNAEQLITLKENANYPHIVVDKNGGKITFTNAMTVGLFETEKSPETVFESTVSVGTFTDKEDSGIYIFNKDASFATETIFNTTGFVSFGSDENSTTSFETTDNPVNFTHTAGKTLITGNLFANDVTLGETEISGTITANNITLEATEIIGDSKLKINETSTDRKITLNGNILSTDLKNLTLNGNVDAFCSSINLGALESKGTFTAQNDLVINAVSTFGKIVDAKENLTINGASKFIQTVEVRKNLIITGKVVFKEAVKSGENLEITGNATFESTEKSVEVGNDLEIIGNANFANTVTTGNNFTIEGDEIIINGAAIAGKSDPFTEGSILLTGTTKITANSLTATKDITLNAKVIETADLIATENIFINKDSEALEQTLNITGDVSSNNFEVVAKTQIFGGEIFVAKDFTSEGETFTFADKVTVNQNAQIQNTGLLKISDFVYGKSFVQKGSEAEIGQVMISGSFVQSGESEKPTATFGSNVYFYNSSENLSDITIGSDKSSIEIKGNLIIAKSKENDVAIKGTVKSNNFALYSGNVDLSGNLSTINDVVVLGEKYSLKDDQTGIENLYSYTENRPGHWSQASYAFETSLPDGTEISQNYAGTVKVLPEKSITVGKNLYANGTVFALSGALGSGKWKLNVPDTSVAANAFCEVYNSEVSDCDAAYQIAALQCTDKSGNINWAFDDETGTVKITKAYSVSDNVIRVEFNKPVRILKDRFTQKQMRFSNEPDENHYFENVYLDEKCTTEASEVVNQYYEENGSKNYFVYVKANSKWNTDATGTFVGEEKSTDYDGVHQNTTICLDFPRAITTTTGADENLLSYIITDLWGKRLTNYSARTTSGTQKIPFENVEDKTGPVLISVKTGQENHTEYDGTKGAQSQPSYDSHNFIEFVYSEFVNFGSENSNGAEEVFLKADDQGIENAKNIQVTQKFGALQNEDITQSGQLKFAGLAKIQNGKIYTGSQNNQGNTDKYVNALYRFDKYSLRYSIAGYTHPTEFVQDDQGNNHKKWVGYIQEAELPTGTVSMICDGKNDLVFDMAGNSQTLVKNNLTVDSSKSGVYGNWDISKPIFAPLRMKAKDDWSYGTNIEALGNNPGFGSTIDRIEFHLFDNTPDFTESDEYSWITERGWCYSLSSDLYTNYSYAADIFGGSRPFIQDEKYRTSGGIRFSSLENASKGFLYTTNSSENPKISFDNSKPVIIGANAKLFTGKSSTRHLANKVDGLYFSLLLKNDDMDLKTVFTISYNDELAFITDLAGNRLLGKTVRTVDRTSPSLNVVLSPINQKDFYVSFLKSINEENLVLVSNDEKELEVTESIRDLLPQCFEIIKINNDGSFELADIQVDKSVVAQKIDIVDDENYTVYKMSLTRNVSLEDVKKLHVRIVNPEKYDYTMRDPVTNIQNSLVTLIQDNLGNYIDKYQTHSLSDIAINAIVPLYAFSSSINEENLMDKEELPDFIKMQNSNFSVRDWDRDQQNYGTLLTGKEISIIAELNQDETSTTQIHDKFRIFLSNADNLVSEKFNREIGGNVRIWFPDIMEKSFNFFSLNKNKKYETTVSSVATSPDVEDCLRFDLPFDMTNKWKSGDQISFIFSILNDDNSQYCIYPAPIFDVQKNIYTLQKSAKFPLFAIRMENPQDITTLDLWSFRLKNLTEQRGGVSILNNVINATYGEKAVVKVNVPQDSNVDVIVMTLDGNIVTYLQHGAISSGEYYFTWNGTNMSGTKVARGLYFVRVIGPNFDETRKVMVVKD